MTKWNNLWDWRYFTCPECQYDSAAAGRLSLLSDNNFCPMCYKRGHYVSMTNRIATDAEIKLYVGV
jgi:hypothetical protein